METQGCIFKVDELELVSFLRNGRGALEEQVDVDWDPTRWEDFVNLIWDLEAKSCLFLGLQ